jgi:hypothetical protein
VRARPDVQSRGRADALERRGRHAGSPQRFQHGRAARSRGDQPDVLAPGFDSPQHRHLVIVPERRDDRCEVAALRFGPHPRPEAERRGELDERPGDRRFPGDRHAWERQARLEEELERAAAEAWIGDHDRAGLLGRAVFGAGRIFSNTGSPVSRQRSACSRTVASAQDPPTNPSIVPSPTTIARSPGRALVGRDAAHDRRLDEGDSRVGELAARALTGAAPWCQCRMASQTRAGVTGMSTWRTPNGSSASTTALTTAGGDPTFEDSPTPLAPSG